MPTPKKSEQKRSRRTVSRLIDLTGQRFGRLTVIERAENNKAGRARWLCRCDCGKYITVTGVDLRTGNTKSCSCLKTARLIKQSTTHGESKTRLFQIWCNMRNRCYNPNVTRYDDYGGRGITVCDEWLHDFTAFRNWALSSGYSDELTLDRIDNDKGYSPDNCRWATWHEQRMNQRRMAKKTE